MKNVNQIIKRHVSNFGSEPEIISQVPAVLTGFGVFSCYCKGYSMSVAISKYLVIAISRRDDQMVKIYNNFSHDTKRFNLNGIKYRKEDRWGNYAKGVLGELVKAGYNISGLNISLSGKVLSFDHQTVASSISLGIGIALNKLFYLSLTEQELLLYCYQGITLLTGMLCNYSSLLTAIHSKKDQLMFFDLKKIVYKYVDYPKDQEGYHLSVIHSNVSPCEIREEVFNKNLEIKKAFESLEKHLKNGSIRDYSVKNIKDRIVPLSEKHRQICSFLLEECSWIEALVKQDFVTNPDKFGRVMQNIQNGITNNLEFSCPEVEWLIKRAKENKNCLSGCMVYSGQSGVIGLLEKDPFSFEFEEKLAEYERIFGFKPDFIRLEPSDGACIIYNTGNINENIINE